MPITTFLHNSELNVPTTNKDLNEILTEVRIVTGQNWQVIERLVHKARPWWAFWRANKIHKSYSVYVFVGGVGPWQEINFYRDDASSSINIDVTAELVIAYLYGMLSGFHQASLKKDKDEDQ